MLDHVFITVEDFDRSIAFYKKALKPLGIAHASDFDGGEASLRKYLGEKVCTKLLRL